MAQLAKVITGNINGYRFETNNLQLALEEVSRVSGTPQDCIEVVIMDSPDESRNRYAKIWRAN